MQPEPMEQMLRIYFMQNWFDLSDPQAEDSLYDIESMRRFAGLELAEDAIPDESTILALSPPFGEASAHRADLCRDPNFAGREAVVAQVRDDHVTIIAAPPSTKNAAEARDPEMHQTKKGKDWHFGMKAHVGTDRRGIVHSLSTTAANVSDISQLPKLLHGQEKEVFGDQAYWSEFHRQCAEASWIVTDQPPRHHTPRFTNYQRFINRCRSSHRARGEHAFHEVKRLVGVRPEARHPAGWPRTPPAAPPPSGAGEPVHAQATADQSTRNVSVVSSEGGERSNAPGPIRARSHPVHVFP